MTLRPAVVSPVGNSPTSQRDVVMIEGDDADQKVGGGELILLLTKLSESHRRGKVGRRESVVVRMASALSWYERVCRVVCFAYESLSRDRC